MEKEKEEEKRRDGKTSGRCTCKYRHMTGKNTRGPKRASGRCATARANTRMTLSRGDGSQTENRNWNKVSASLISHGFKEPTHCGLKLHCMKSKRAVRSKQMSEWCERMDKRVARLFFNHSLCNESVI